MLWFVVFQGITLLKGKTCNVVLCDEKLMKWSSHSRRIELNHCRQVFKTCCVTWRHIAAVNGKVKWYHHSNDGYYNGNALNAGIFILCNDKIIPLIKARIVKRTFFLSLFDSPSVGQGLLIAEVWRSTLRHAALGRNPLDEWSARRRDLYLTTHKTYNRQIFMASGGFEPTIPVNELPKNHALEQCFSTFVRPRPGKFYFFYKTRARSQQIYS